MEFKQIQYFACLYEEGTVTRAASRLNIVQPALSTQIRNLELGVGEALFTRSPKGMHPTAAGHRMYRLFQPLLEDFERSKIEITGSRAEFSGTIHIGVISSVAESILAHAIEQFSKLHPRVTLSITEGFTEPLCDAVAGGQLDAAIINRPRKKIALRSELMVDEQIVLVSSNNQKFNANGVKLKDITQMKLVLPTRQHGLRKILDSIAAAENLELTPSHEVDSINAIMQLVSVSDYATLLPALAASSPQRNGGLKITPIHSPSPRRQIACVSHPRYPLTAAAASFIQICTTLSVNVRQKSTD